jgi:hypothetical protein
VVHGEAAGAGAERDEAGDNAQQRALAAAGGPEKAQKLAARDLKIDPGERLDAGGKALPDPVQFKDRPLARKIIAQGFIPTRLSTNCSVYALR